MSSKANLVNRYLAGAVDFGIALIIYKVFPEILKINTISASAFILFKDCINSGKSIGKTVFNLNTLNLQDGTPSTYRESLLRNFFFIIPIVNIVMILAELYFITQDTDGYRIGDKVAKTYVVDDDTKLNNEIQDSLAKTSEKNEKNENR